MICEVNAQRWRDAGRPDIAGAFKRAAHLALTSMKRWQRPSGELWIVKNYADPATRHGFEGYSFHSQYNLLAVAMLCIAYERADDAIAERPLPAETGSYVFDLHEDFHKVVAAAGGTYVEIETGAELTYDASGLMRVHKAGVALSPYSSNSAPLRYQGPSNDPVKIGLTPGLQWKNAATEEWHSLAEARNRASTKNNPPIVETDDLTIGSVTPARVEFSVHYGLKGAGLHPLVESYVVDASGVDVTTRLQSPAAPAQVRLLFPALVSDGARDTEVKFDGAKVTIHRVGGTLIWRALAPVGLRPTLEAPRVATRNGYVQALVAPLPPGAREARWHLDLQPDGAALPPRDGR